MHIYTEREERKRDIERKKRKINGKERETEQSPSMSNKPIEGCPNDCSVAEQRVTSSAGA